MKVTGPEGLKFGRDGFDKIALLGSAPSSLRLAPFHDESWAIWGCSPGAYGQCLRSDVWWEIHRWEPPAIGNPLDPANVPWFSPEYAQFLKEYKGPVITNAEIDSIPNACPLPFQELIDKYGPYFFTSSVAWMLALAIEFKPKAIGLWGIDMSASSEYAFQRPGCQHFIGVAMREGIEVILPPESDLMRPSTLYGISENSPKMIKWKARLSELQQRKANAVANMNAISNEAQFLNGAIDNLEYMLSTWVDEVPSDLRMAVGESKRANPLITIHHREVKIEPRPTVTINGPSQFDLQNEPPNTVTLSET